MHPNIPELYSPHTPYQNILHQTFVFSEIFCRIRATKSPNIWTFWRNQPKKFDLTKVQTDPKGPKLELYLGQESAVQLFFILGACRCWSVIVPVTMCSPKYLTNLKSPENHVDIVCKSKKKKNMSPLKTLNQDTLFIWVIWGGCA